ncbi:hypothetical protein DM46_2572 [Burkholderia mallei]|nr:hypothetical protein DM46_2572 [Burkholderia mallei]
MTARGHQATNAARSFPAIHEGGRPRPFQVAPVFGSRYFGLSLPRRRSTPARPNTSCVVSSNSSTIRFTSDSAALRACMRAASSLIIRASRSARRSR